ncbi:hypothetical protein B4Q13_17305, partial [Lacticaseibacillus rhamnosus]
MDAAVTLAKEVLGLDAPSAITSAQSRVNVASQADQLAAARQPALNVLAPGGLAGLDPRVKLLRSEVNLGVSGGRNVGIAAALADGARRGGPGMRQERRAPRRHLGRAQKKHQADAVPGQLGQRLVRRQPGPTGGACQNDGLVGARGGKLQSERRC